MIGCHGFLQLAVTPTNRTVHDMIRIRRARLSAGAVLGAGTLITSLVVLSGPAATTLGATSFVPLAYSVPMTTDAITGSYSSPSMSVEVALAPRDQSGLNSLLRGLYTKGSATYHHWLTSAQFDARFAPTAAARDAVATYLAAGGLKTAPSVSPFLVRATGPSSQVTGTFHTKLSIYKNRKGQTYFSNSTPVELPSSLAGSTLGVVGLTNTVRAQSMVIRPAGARQPASSKCETPYPTRQQLYDFANAGVSFPAGYGDAPGCNGLTPAQTNSLYDAPSVGPKGKGAGVTAAVFELSGYQESDIVTWAHHYYGAAYTPRLVNIITDGGPLNPVCPNGDQCPAQFNEYSGDIEVDADIEETLAIAPDVSKLLVYNAPNDFTGQTELDQYAAIASQDQAETVSSSWGECEQDAGITMVRAENTIFEQMAAQGQAMFSSAGDTGPYDCIRSDGSTGIMVDDPPAQPWVTSVGGTTFEGFNPDTNAHPSYPSGVEDVWNVDNLCGDTSNLVNGPGGMSGFFWCGETGAGGGGSSMFWGRPSWQTGPGVINPYTTYSNGLNQCGLAPVGQACREVPDISANADEYTGYSEYCTGNASTPDSTCATITSTPAGWFAIGGTSLSSPLWSAIAADRDSYTGTRSGSFNPLVYGLFNADPGLYFHHIGPSFNNNGHFPTTPGYDEATGIGTPIMKTLITGV
jgi:subtilase family serine protease